MEIGGGSNHSLEKLPDNGVEGNFKADRMPALRR